MALPSRKAVGRAASGVTKRAKSIADRMSRVASEVVQQTVAGAESAVESAKEFVQDHT
jgi:hypothetical protein